MEKLKEENIITYLPYKIRYVDNENIITDLKTVDIDIKMVNFGWGNAKNFDEIKLILHPLSDLTKEFVFQNLSGMHISEEDIDYIQANPVGYLKYYQIIYLLQNHFDVFSLIKNNLAIDINTLKP